jgi:hypothetical protein
MTATEKLARANRWRIRKECGKWSSTDEDGWNGAFLVPVDGEMWQVLLGDGMGWKHLSVTNAQKKQVPPWNVMCRLRDYFFDDDAWVVQFHPPRDAYINDHPFVLHLWQSIDAEMPTPLAVMV